MNQIIEKPNKNEWGLTAASTTPNTINWKESAEYKKTAQFVRTAYGPFGKVVFTGIWVIFLVALGIWGVSFLVDALELVFNAVRNVPNASGAGAAIGSVAGALFAACWKTAMGAVILFPVWYGFKIAYNRFLILLAAEQNSSSKE
ncbi:MAG: hypothetical protein EYC62_03840 [Alphaproteobacteria bacterium]|nr:MAG: hypothetical protein EYC62_03840 [Alphaproteobacteria bacterium]